MKWTEVYMNYTIFELLNVLKEDYSEEEIIKYTRFNKELFYLNLEKFKTGNVDQLALKQYFLMYEMVPNVKLLTTHH